MWRGRDEVVVEVDQLLLAQLYPLLRLFEVSHQPDQVVEEGVVSFGLGFAQLSQDDFPDGYPSPVGVSVQSFRLNALLFKHVLFTLLRFNLQHR